MPHTVQSYLSLLTHTHTISPISQLRSYPSFQTIIISIVPLLPVFLCCKWKGELRLTASEGSEAGGTVSPLPFVFHRICSSLVVPLRNSEERRGKSARLFSHLL